MLHRVRQATLTQEVTYRQGNLTVTVPATVGTTVFEEVSHDGIVHRTEAREFLIDASDLVVDALAFAPAVGDRITYSDLGGNAVVYTVAAFGSEPASRRSDPHSTVLRIHAKRGGLLA